MLSCLLAACLCRRLLPCAACRCLVACMHLQGVRFLQLSPGEFFFTTLKVGP